MLIYAKACDISDTFAWSRFLKFVPAGSKLQCDANLVSLMARSFPEIAVAPVEPLHLLSDQWVPISELQTSLGIADRDVPCPPYLRPDPAAAAYYAGALPTGCVGLQSRPGNFRRGIPGFAFGALRPLFERWPCVSLNPPPSLEIPQGIIQVLPSPPVLDVDWAEIAAIISQCRAVVTSTTEAMHLAGALDVRAHMMWAGEGWAVRGGAPRRRIVGARENLEGPFGDWYPSVRGYVSQGDWPHDTVERIAEALQCSPV